VLIEEGGENAADNGGSSTSSGGRILEAHLLGTHAEEIVNIFALAIRLGLNTTDIKDAIFSYPTKSSDISYML
jgi:glutathione reductase (NADPH)